MACSNVLLWKLDTQKDWRNTSWRLWDERTLKILRVSWTAKKTNVWVLNKAGVKTVRHRQSKEASIFRCPVFRLPNFPLSCFLLPFFCCLFYPLPSPTPATSHVVLPPFWNLFVLTTLYFVFFEVVVSKVCCNLISCIEYCRRLLFKCLLFLYDLCSVLFMLRFRPVNCHSSCKMRCSSNDTSNVELLPLM